MTKGRAFDITPQACWRWTSRVEAGLLLIEVDFNSGKS
jgi:hypothetical protein